MTPDAAAPPPRPQLSDTTPPPITPIEFTLPKSVQTVRVLSLISLTMGLIISLFAGMRNQAIADRLTETLTGLDVNESTEAARALAGGLVWAAVGAVLIVTILEAIWWRRLRARRRFARTAQGITLALHFPVALFAVAVIAAPGDDGMLDRALIIGHFALASAAFVVGLSARVNSWLRS